MANDNPLGFAGLWDAWKDKDGHWLQSFAIVQEYIPIDYAPSTPVVGLWRDGILVTMAFADKGIKVLSDILAPFEEAGMRSK